jgi:signal transduction histidine kinase
MEPDARSTDPERADAQLAEAQAAMRSWRARAERAERALQSNELLVAGLIHDLRTPLMAINLSAEVAVARTQDESVQQAVKRIRSSTHRMSRTFDHLLNLSRQGAGASPPEFAEGDLRAVTGAALAAARAAHPQATFELAEEGDLRARFDAAALQDVLGGLLATAVAHGREQDVIRLRVDGSHRDRVWIEVSMPAVIPPDVQETMFVPGPNRAGREVPGLGLGLSAVDGAVRTHGGSIVGRSRAPDGTTFEMLLPRDPLGRL